MTRARSTVALRDDQRQQLRKITRAGRSTAREITHAHVLLKSDAGLSDQAIAEQLSISTQTVVRVRKRFANETLEAALTHRRPSAYKPRKVDGRLEAHIIALASGDPPDGRAHWSLRLLADVLVQLEHVSSISPETVRQVLKKTNSSHT